MTKRKNATHVHHKMSILGLILWSLGTMRIYKDGDGFGSVFYWWNPISLLLWVVMLVPCALLGEKIGSVVPFKLSKYWKMNRAKLQWVHPFQDLKSLSQAQFTIKVPT